MNEQLNTTASNQRENNRRALSRIILAIEYHDRLWSSAFFHLSTCQPSWPAFRWHLVRYHEMESEVTHTAFGDVDRFVHLQGEALVRRRHRVNLHYMSHAQRHCC
jgi:hypothetical protein